MVHLRNRGLPLKNGHLTTKEREFAKALALTGDATYAAKKAGYQRTASPLVKAKDPAIMKAVEEIQRAWLIDEALPLSRAAVIDLLQPGAPPGERGRMARYVQDKVDTMFGDKLGDKDPSEMTADELARAIDLLSAAAAAKAVDVTPVDDDNVFG
jgi:hypothetical protein